MSTSNITEFSFKASYEKIGSINNSLTDLWILFHGYAQLSSEFIQNFKYLSNKNTCLIAPQGLSKFYLKSVTGKIGASWMTNHERDIDITNYLSYLNSIYQKEINNIRHIIKLNLLGFSQGVHTLTRWIVRHKMDFDRLILWGGFFAEEITHSEMEKYFGNKKVYFVIGDNDRFFLKEQRQILEKKLYSLPIEIKVVKFDGGHEIVPEILNKIIEE